MKQQFSNSLSAQDRQKYFLIRSPMSSIFGFSNILIFFGGKQTIRSLLFQVCRGGKQFYNEHVLNGQLFRMTVLDACHLTILPASLIRLPLSSYYPSSGCTFLEGVSLDFVDL